LERLTAVLFLVLLLIVPTAVHWALTESQRLPRSQQVALSVASQNEISRGGSTGSGASASRDSVGERSDREAGQRDISPELSPIDLVYNGRGLWLTEWSRGRAVRVDRGPVPPQSTLLPILMYHHVEPIDFQKSNSFVSDLTLPPAQFELQLRYLKERGFRSVSMDDLAYHLQGRRELPRYSVVFTFDDGYLDNYSYAYRLLQQYGFTGTFFIITGLVGKSGYLSWQQIREMANTGMEIGSHTVSHPDLARIAPSQRDRELVDSKRTLEEYLGVSVRALSYPGGSFSGDVIAAAQRAGYAVAVTTQYGATHDHSKPFELSRVRIHGTDTLSLFRWRIEQYFPVAGPFTS